MSRDLLRRATVALQHAMEARTIEFQVRCAEEARSAFEEARRAFDAHAETIKARPTEAARLIASRSLDFAVTELERFERRLCELEERIAEAARSETDPRNYRRARLAD